MRSYTSDKPDETCGFDKIQSFCHCIAVRTVILTSQTIFQTFTLHEPAGHKTYKKEKETFKQ